MEDSGGMVAVVQGLKDAGLAITLLSSRYPQLGAITAGRGNPCPNQACQTVADTCTETAVRDRPADINYRSSYQMAHCISSGFSPTRLPQYSLQGFQQYRSFTSRSPDEEAFVESLRKYPTSPVRSRSADLIERMLSYTQTKNGAKYSNTRSAKSLPSKEASKHVPLHSDEIPTRDTGIPTNEFRPNYGYKRDVELVPVPMGNRRSRYDNQIGMYDYLKSNSKDKKLKGSEVRYLTNVKQCLREKFRQICDEEPATICPKIQNRYSQHRRKYHRAEGSQKSQKVNYCKSVKKCTTCQGSMAQDSAQNDIQPLPSTSTEPRESRVNKSSPSFKHSKACFCDRPGPCDCGTQPSRSTIQRKAHSEYPFLGINDHKQCVSICKNECDTTEDPSKRQLKEIILNWSRDLPVYANFNTTDSMNKEKIINELIDTISKLQKDNMYFENIEENIKKCIKLLPMWRPQNKEDQEAFENQLALSIIEKIKNITSEKYEFQDQISKWVDSIPFTRDSIDKETIVNELIHKLEPITQNRPPTDKEYKEVLKCSIVNALNDLPIDFSGSRTTAINTIADQLVEKLHTIPNKQPKQSNIKNLVMDWVKTIPEFASSTNTSNDDVLINDLITRLNHLQNQDVDNKQEQINNILDNWLNLVEEKKKCRIDRNTKYIYTTKLTDKLINLHQMDHPKENINNAVQKWYDAIQDSLGMTFIDNQKDLEILATKLRDIQRIENDENRQNTMRQEILKWLQNLQGKQHRHVESGIQENLVNKLITMIQGEHNVPNVSENGLITQNIWKWLESQPEFKQDSTQYRDLVTELSGKLQDIRDKNGELTEYDVKVEVSNWLEKLSKQHGIQVEKSDQKKLQDNLLSAINPVKRRKNWDKLNNIQEVISKEVSDIINNNIKSLEENGRKRLKEQITQAIVQNWKYIESAQNNEPISKIKNILKQATNLPETEIMRLANTLIEKVKDATLSNLGDTLQEEPLILNSTLKTKLRNKVDSILKMLPLKDNQHVKDVITDTLVRRFKDYNNDSGFDIIYETLKKSDVSESDALTVTNKILEMSNQFRNEIIETTYQDTSYGSGESLWMQKQMFMQRLEKEITDFMEKVLNESSSFHKETNIGSLYGAEALEGSINHYNKFTKLPLKTSTPTNSDNGIPINVESQYKNKVKEIIKNWIIGLQIDTIDERFIDDMANDIATDIIDRERYIQLSKIKRSSQNEMEHLKYQVFKWTSKLPNPIDLTAKVADIKGLLKSLEALSIPDLSRQTTNQQYVRENRVDSGSTVEYDFELIEINIKEAIWKWLNNITKLKLRSSEDRRGINDIITELSSKLTNILKLDVELSNFKNLCKDEVNNHLRKLNTYVEKTDEQLEHRASELFNYLINLEFFVNILNRNKDISKEDANRLQKKDAIKKAVQDWCQKLPLKTGISFDDMKDIVDNLAEAISRYLLITDLENINIFMDEILINLKKLPLQFDKGHSKILPEFTENLIETLKSVLNDSEKYHSSIEDDSSVRKPILKKAAEVMHDNIQNWCENLPLDLGVTNVDMEQINMIKQNLATKLLKKVGELNLDPEIFHDDYLYKDVLTDEIDTILNDLAKTKQLEEILPTLKQKLIKDLLEAKEGVKNEMAGFAYKQQLKDAISKTLSSIGLPVTEETPFEVLKDNLADAFISLHYVGDSEELKKKCKDKIFKEVNKFCDDYLKRNPSTPLNVHQLNEELYKALKKVPIPREESMRREVEQIRVKDIVTDWLDDLSLEETPSHVQENKIISILAKRLLEIENEAELKPDLDVDGTMNNEISKWLKKIKLKPDNESKTETITKKLINKLKATKKSRKFNESTIRKSINYEELTGHSPRYPPSQLSAEDRAHLQRIKDRTSIERTGLKIDDKKDASVSPVPIAAGIQTEENQVPDNYIFQRISQNASIQTIIRESEPTTSITPQVIVKEYYWNSQGSPTIQRSGSVLSTIQPRTANTLSGSTQQRATTDPPQVTTASQTKPLPVSKGTITQEASIEQIVKMQIQNDSIGTSTKSSCLTKSTTTAQEHISNEIHLDPQMGRYNPDDYLQLNSRKRPEIKSCKPCRGRAALSRDFEDSPEGGTSKSFRETRSPSQQIGQGSTEDEDENCLHDINNLSPPCFRQPVCQTPSQDMELVPKYKRRSMQSCTCGKPVVTKCTIRPQSRCQHSHNSNKSCYVSKKHCPKCWDGFCPHPSYLYFRKD